MKTKYQQEYDALPPWAKALVDMARTSIGHGIDAASEGRYSIGDRIFLVFKKDGSYLEASKALGGLLSFSSAMSAPHSESPEMKTAIQNCAGKRVNLNVVELTADPEDGGGFDQPCMWGNRCGFHAVYCHHPLWPDSPTKCRRSSRDADYAHKDCPGFVPNPDHIPTPK